MATTMTMSAACAQPLAARKSFGSKAKLGAPVKNAVITVPAYFNDAQRQSTQVCRAFSFFSLCVYV